jgi:hypothetical protein
MTRRPLPALVSLLALLLLTALVWWRVLHRDGANGASSSPCSTPTPTATATATTRAALPAPAQVSVEVLNATNRTGIAGKARTALVQDGFKIPKPAGNLLNTKITGVAEIRYGASAAKGAQLLQYYFPGAVLKQTTAATATVIVALGDGYKGVATPATVQAALQKANVAVSTPAPTPTPSGSAGSASC